jgi:hypothetical protein
MKKIYESFEEIAADFVNGDHLTHKGSKHDPDECLAWQHGVREFARWLDACGVKIIENPEVYDTLWDSFRPHKPDSFAECGKAQG